MVFWCTCLVLERLESPLAHGWNLIPRCKDKKLQHGEQAGINFDAWKNTVIILDNWALLFKIDKTTPHFLILFHSLRQDKIRNPVEFVLKPCRKADQRKLNFICRANARWFIHFYLHPTSPTQNSPTMANDSLPDLQEQWQWHHLNHIVVISLL
jgi:hypothetical protein